MNDLPLVPDHFTEGLEVIRNLRRRLFKAIGEALSADGHCKRYEGAFSIDMPNYFEHKDGGSQHAWGVGLACYVIGPSRHYSWTGSTLLEAAQKADAEVSRWIADHDEWWRVEGSSLVDA